MAGAKIFAEPYMELLFYSALIFAAMLVFMAMSRSYRYVEDVLSTVNDEDEDKSTENVFNLEPGLATDRVESQRSPLEQQQ